MDHMNIFNPFSNKPFTFEDQLTRAFLIVMDRIPLVFNQFLELIRDYCDKNTLKCSFPTLTLMKTRPRIGTQTSNIEQKSGKWLSVLITNEEYPEIKCLDLVWSGRGAVYDGIICCDPVLIISIENKLDVGSVWAEQLSPSEKSLPDDHAVELYPKAVGLAWKDVIDSLTGLWKSGLLSPVEYKLVEDFIEYVASNFSYLNPYRNLQLCGNDKFLLRKRCGSMVEKIATERGWNFIKSPDGSTYLESPCKWFKYIYLEPNLTISERESEDWSISLKMYPASTLVQAREFYSLMQNSKSKFLSLREKGWRIDPNLNFAFMATKLQWIDAHVRLEDYIEYWEQKFNNQQVRQVQRDTNTNFRDYFETLLNDKMISRDDLSSLDELFTRTNRNHVNPCPEISMVFTWSKKDSVALDHSNAFYDQVNEHINEVLNSVSLYKGRVC